ncbi:hypothetical protein HGP16_29835 [Rhizobium sp. P40RR-XXII]|uniref:hypothetical protein n=1 Tax=Rhizobium sp. P40RR-XXII TaxID=2726739 RepID=UPI001456D419|nr:hypothetical protein [Rhizobium sp. P40RR-XXII]NLS20709.1 hypothetical protein [Rhizobium sp. P40RR-XXII]NLS20711.1 hypothetical protein [Rhizobium sp. P40RR-XXII]
MYLAHGVLLKLLTFGLPGVVGFFESLGLPGWPFNAPNGGWEYPAYLIVLSIAQFLLGDGRFAMRPSSLTIAHR